MKITHVAALTGIFLVLAGCTPPNPQGSNPIACTMEYRYGLTLNVTDQNGQPIDDAKITVLQKDESSGESAAFEHFGGDGVYPGLGEGRGHYRLRVEKSGYESQEFDVNLEHDACHVHPQSRDVMLQIIAL